MKALRVNPTRWYGALATRSFTSAVAAAKEPTYNMVKFEKEDMQHVFDEVPDFKYYYIGEENPNVYPYSNVPMTETVLDASDKQEPPKVDGELRFSKLENGLRIASVDKGGLTASLGLFVKAGSRFETLSHDGSSNLGVSHMAEMMAFTATGHISELRQMKTFETLGADGGCSVGRDTIVYQAECMRGYIPYFVPLLVGNFLFPRFLKWEVKAAHPKIAKAQKKLEATPDGVMTELLHETAWHRNTYGHRLYATEASKPYFTEETIREYFLNFYSPDRIVFVGVNVDHNELCKWLMRSFVDYNTIPPKNHDVAKPVYTGGDQRLEAPGDMTHLAFGFPNGGWNSEDCVTATVLQTILGGGGSFSTGGPGKGLFSRLFTQVMSTAPFIDSCCAFNNQYSDAGIFGIYAVCLGQAAPQTCAKMWEQLNKMGDVNVDELQRGKRALINSIYINLESRAIRMEDIGRQLSMSDKYITPAELVTAINNTTAVDIKGLADRMLKQRLTFVAYGNILHVPHRDEIVAMKDKK